MANILLISSSDISGIPQNVVDWMYEYNKQGHKFIVGDSKGGDSHFHKAISSIGAIDNACIYCMDTATSNSYGLPLKVFNTEYDSDNEAARVVAADNSIEPYIITGIRNEKDIGFNRQWYEFRDRRMVADCDIAIAVISCGDIPKRIDRMITLLNLSNKPCYIIRVA